MRNPFQAPTISEMFLKRSGFEDEGFYDYIRLPNGTFKTTAKQRHTDVDERLCRLLEGESRTVSILDVAASSGTSTVELSDCLTRHGVRHEMFGGDLALYAKCVRVPPMTVLCTEENFLYQVDIGRLAFPNTPPSKLTSAVFSFARLVLWLHDLAVRRPRRIKMLSRLAEESDVVFESGDVFGELLEGSGRRTFDVIRASNILHRGYFSSKQIWDAIRNLKSRLNDGGLLIINRTSEAGNLCTIYRMLQGRLTAVEEVNGGSDVADLIADNS